MPRAMLRHIGRAAAGTAMLTQVASGRYRAHLSPLQNGTGDAPL